MARAFQNHLRIYANRHFEESTFTRLGLAWIFNYFDKISKRTGLVDFDLKILKQLDIKTIDPKLRPVKKYKKKGIYIVSSGMLVERTPSYNVAASLLNTGSNGIFFIGYCDPEPQVANYSQIKMLIVFISMPLITYPNSCFY